MKLVVLGSAIALILIACGGGATSGTASPSAPVSQQCPGSTSKPNPTATGATPPAVTGLRLPSGFTMSLIAHVGGARELAIASNGDLFVGTNASAVYIVPRADDYGLAGTPTIFAQMADAPAAGLTLANCSLYVGTQFGVWRIPYAVGDRSSSSAPIRIAKVRTDASRSDHITTSVAFSGKTLFAGVGSSSNNAWPEIDATHATIQSMGPNGENMQPVATQIRNAIALTINPQTGTLWAGVAGQDELQTGHPYEIFDAVASRGGVANYGWPFCYENKRDDNESGDPHECAQAAVPKVVFPAYETPIGAAFYPASPAGPYAFPSRYRGGVFVTLHGSWHQSNGIFIAPPRVAFVPMNGDSPQTPVNWGHPTTQWQEFVGGYQDQSGNRSGRPTGIAVGPQGDLFVADDDTGNIYRIRPK
ncbi:MAG: hypothetical protein M3Y21_10820 [Candidatus Eremiobacteraeota bacterium]|nr:hypothetical protein [Candidatus Eremiobacteraeota bacterium]